MASNFRVSLGGASYQKGRLGDWACSPQAFWRIRLRDTRRSLGSWSSRDVDTRHSNSSREQFSLSYLCLTGRSNYSWTGVTRIGVNDHAWATATAHRFSRLKDNARATSRVGLTTKSYLAASQS